MALTGKQKTENYDKAQAKRGLVRAPRGWVPEGTGWMIKDLMRDLCDKHREKTGRGEK